MSDAASQPLSSTDLSMWWADQPRQRTTMAMLMCLDRRPDPERLRAAVWRAVDAMPRLRQCVVEAPLHLSLPRWQDDPTFDLDFHLRRYSLPAEVAAADALPSLFRAIGPIYERPFDRTRPLWELIELEGPQDRAALFFRLHHAVADGVGANTILGALTDAERDADPAVPPPRQPPGAWPDPGLLAPIWQLGEALARRLGEDAERARGLAELALTTLRDPRHVVHAASALAIMADDLRAQRSSPRHALGRSRHLSGLELPFAPLREVSRKLGGRVIDVLLTGVAGAVGAWHAARGLNDVKELQTFVPVSLRPRSQQNSQAGLGNRSSAFQLRLPVAIENPVERFHEIHRRVKSRVEHPSLEFLPAIATALAALPRSFYRSLAYRASESIDLIVTNVPGIPVPRYVAGSEITEAFPFAPVAPHTPVSIALYGYRDRLFVGLDADGTAMPDVEVFHDMLEEAFLELVREAGARPARTKQRGAG